jgi:hypothetical protein
MQKQISTSPNRTDAIENFIFDGKKISAIRLYRKGTHYGIRRAKRAIDDLEASLLLRCPDCFSAGYAGRGYSLSTFLAVIAVTVSVFLVYFTYA